MMLYPFVLHLMLVGVSRIHCEIKTVTEVSVEAGGSISIPCLYEKKYKDNLKYLCKGYWSLFCKEVVKTTNRKMQSKRFSITDDTEQRIFAVTINDLMNKDKYFWCLVEIENKRDVGQLFYLSVTSGTASLYVSQQEIRAFERGSVTVTCHYKYQSVNEWCRLGSTCVRDEIGIIDGTSVKINKSVPGVFNVTMSDLRTESSGWYWCSSELFQMPVHIDVYALNSATATATSATGSTSFTGTSRLHTTILPNSTKKETSGVILKDEHKRPDMFESMSSSTKVIILISTLTMQLLIVLAALFGWKMMKKKKAKKVNANAMECDQSVNLVQQMSDSDVFYATIAHKQNAPVQTKELCAEWDLDVIYSSVVTATQLNIKRVTIKKADTAILFEQPGE